MTMLLITKELAEALIVTEFGKYGMCCFHCDSWIDNQGDGQHEPNCIVTRAKLLLEQEWGIKS